MCLRISSVALIVLAAALPIAASVDSCSIACQKCLEGLEHPSIVTVFCEMCSECKVKMPQNRRMWNFARENDESSMREIIEVDDPADCPTPAPCLDDLNEDNSTKKTTTTTTTPPPTTKPAGRRCPPPPICLVKNPPCPPLPLPPPPPVYPPFGYIPQYPGYPPPLPAYPPPPYLQGPPMIVQPYVPEPPAATTTTAVPKSTTEPTTTTPPLEYVSVFVGFPDDFDYNDGDNENPDEGIGRQ